MTVTDKRVSFQSNMPDYFNLFWLAYYKWFISSYFIFFLIIRSYLQNKHKKTNRHPFIYYRYVIRFAREYWNIDNSFASRRFTANKFIKGCILHETGINKTWGKMNYQLNSRRYEWKVKNNDVTSNGIMNHRDKSHGGEKVLVLSRRDKGGGVKRCLAQW